MIRNIFLSLLIASSAVPAWAGKQDAEWRNPEKNQENREARRANFFAFESESLARAGEKAKSSCYLSMEGLWRFRL